MNDAALRSFRAPRWLRWLSLAALPLFAGAAVQLVGGGGSGWLALSSVLMLLLAVAGVIDAWSSRVEIHPGHLVVVANARRRIWVRDAIAEVSSERGVPVSLRLQDGGLVRLPDVAGGNVVLAAALRGWLHALDRPQGRARADAPG